MIRDLLRKGAVAFLVLLALQSLYSFFTLEEPTALEALLFFVVIAVAVKGAFWLWQGSA